MSYEPTFNQGDVAQLRSGGPLVTVTYDNQTHETWPASAGVIYFNSVTGLFEKVSVPTAALKHATSLSEPADARGMRNTSVTKSSMST